MRVWSFVACKGGAGKTTLTTQLAVYAEARGETVCLTDLDPQASAFAWSRIRGTSEPVVLQARPEKLAELAAAAPALGVTLMLIDTASHDDTGALAAIRAGGLIFCPVQPSLFDVAALKDTLALLDLANKRPFAMALVNALPATSTEEAYGEAALAIESLGLPVAKAGICHRRAFMIAASSGQGVTETSEKSKAAAEVRALWDELDALSRELERRHDEET
jgi:chromosome partitioning protein